MRRSGIALLGIVASAVLCLAVLATPASAAGPQLSFVVQPSDTTAGQPITPAVEVWVLDSKGQLVSKANVAVTMSFGTNTTGATLYGTKTVYTTSDGTATGTPTGKAIFPSPNGFPLVVDRAGTYTLKATASKFAPATSDPQGFVITGVAANCAGGGNCTTGPAGNATKNTPTTGSLTLPPQTLSCTLTDYCPFLSINASKFTGGFCGGFACIGNVIFYNWPTNANGLITAVGIWDRTAQTTNKGASKYDVFKEGVPNPLPNCSSRTPDPSEAPCVVSKNRNASSSDLVITVLFSPSDTDATWGTH